MIDLGTLLGICPVGPCDCVLLCASCTSYGSPLDQTGKKRQCLVVVVIVSKITKRLKWMLVNKNTSGIIIQPVKTCSTTVDHPPLSHGSPLDQTEGHTISVKPRGWAY